MGKLYDWIYDYLDRVWQRIAKTVFVRFQFDLPTEKLRHRMESGRLVFAMVDGGLVDWLILSSWCRSQGLGAIDIANRKRILFLSQPLYFLKTVFKRASYADLFLLDRKVPRVLILSGRERKKINVPTPTESLLSDIYARTSTSGEAGNISLVPVLIVWRRHTRGSRRPSEYLLGLSSKPNLIGKLWYLLRRRTDSRVSALGFLPLASKEHLEKVEGFDENEAMRAAKSARRRVLVSVQQESRVLLGPRYHSPSLIKETVLRDSQVQALITKISQERGIDRKRILSEAYQDLTEIVADYHYRFIEVIYVILTWFFSKVFDGLNAKDEDWQAVREIMKTKPVAFIPCHRSHLDYLVIPYLLFEHDMITPHIAAGVNLSFWPLGPLLRMGGAFFIRRSFRNDPLYQALLVEYVQTLLKNRYNVKFFIEGTRSRSGKMLAPAYGMLKMVMEAYENRICEDVALIPVSICYDEVPEQGSYSHELAGGKKVKESAIELLRSRKIVSGRFGKVYVRVAPTLFAKTIYQSDEKDPRRRLQKTAFQVCKSICDITPITPKSILSSVLLCHRNPLLTLEEALRLSLELADYVEYVGMELSVSERDSLRRALEQTLRRLRKSGVLTEIENVPRRYVCDSRKRALLGFYKNNAIHCFAIPSIALLAYYCAWQRYKPGGASAFEEDFKSQALLLRDILKFEFFFNPRAEFLQELEKAAGFLFGDVKTHYGDPSSWSGALYKRFPTSSDLSVLARLLGELLESYLCFAEFVKASDENTWEKKHMLSKALRFAEARQQNGDILFPEGLSIINYGNALLYLENQGILSMTKEGDKTVIARSAATGKLEETVAILDEYRDLMQEKEETFQHAPDLGT